MIKKIFEQTDNFDEYQKDIEFSKHIKHDLRLTYLGIKCKTCNIIVEYV